MKTQFLVQCSSSFHEGNSVLIRTFPVVENADHEPFIQPLGTDAKGEIVQVLIIDDSPSRLNFPQEHLESFVKTDRSRIRHEFECECGLKVVLKHLKLQEIGKKLIDNGVSWISLTSLDKYSSG